MTNEPPRDGAPDADGEELVEADLPTTSSTRDPAPSAPTEGEPDALEVFDERLRQAEANLDADIDAAAQARFDRTVRAIREEYGPDVDAEALARHDLGLPDPEPELPPPPYDELLDSPPQPLADDRVRTAIETTITPPGETPPDDIPSGGGLPPPPSLTSPLPRPLEDRRVRQAIEPTISSGSRTLQMLVVGALVAAGGIAGLMILLNPFGGDDSDASALPATTAEATAATTEAPATATPAQPLAEVTGYEQFTLTHFQPVADADGDLWVLLELVTPWGEDPPEVEFIYSALIGAGVVLDGRINGSLYTISEGLSYAESVFGSPDFPRSSSDFTAEFQAAQADLWITDEGAIAVHLPGPSATGGINAALVAPDTTLITVNVIQTEPGVADFNVRLEQAIGEILAADSYPLPSWVEIQPDTEPLQLNVPDTSNSN